MKTIKYIEKIMTGITLVALVWLMATSFNPLTGAALFFSCFLLALVYAFLSPWILSPEHKAFRPVFKPIVTGLTLAFFILCWVPGIYNWPLSLPLYEVAIVLFLLLIGIEFFGKKSALTYAYRKNVLKRVLIIGTLSSFLTLAPKHLVYPLMNINNESRIMSEIASGMYKKKTSEALGLAKYWEKKNKPGSLFLRLYGEVLLAHGDSANSLMQFKKSYMLDSNLSAQADLLLLERKPAFLRLTKSVLSPYLFQDGLDVATPESQGIKTEVLQTYFSAGEQIPLLISMMVIKNNKVVAEKYYHSSPWHVQWTFSTWKSMIGVVTGIAVDKGFVKNTDQKLSDFFSAKEYSLQPIVKEITLNDLLTMRSGINSSEEGTYWEDADPAKEILSQPLAAQPGKSFEYASRNMFLVKEIIEKSSKQSFSSFCKNYADSLQILRTVFNDSLDQKWDGSRLTLRDMAKFGLLINNKGKYKNTQIISENWIKEATSEQVKFKEPNEGYTGYGYFFWLREINGHKLIAARGKGGQFIFCISDQNLVIATFGSEWNDRGFSAIENLLNEMVEKLCYSSTP